MEAPFDLHKPLFPQSLYFSFVHFRQNVISKRAVFWRSAILTSAKIYAIIVNEDRVCLLANEEECLISRGTQKSKIFET